MLASTLHAMAILLRTCKWDWFINLSASDYPLVTQDDLIHAFSDLLRNLNFIQHSSRLGWKLNKRAKPIIMDPGLYSLNKSELWWVIKQRTLPTAFKLYTDFQSFVNKFKIIRKHCMIGYPNNRISIMVIIVSDEMHMSREILGERKYLVEWVGTFYIKVTCNGNPILYY
ncbi:beta-glucuronosyltransferase GlcAT14A [Fagus crenata]